MLPSYLRKDIPKARSIARLREILDEPSICTVCESLKCPNIGECFSENTLTFMILGDICTRDCAFCACQKGKPGPVDPDEPERIAEAVRKLELRYVVVTSVTRDDLPEGGAGQFVSVIETLRGVNKAENEFSLKNHADTTEFLIALWERTLSRGTSVRGRTGDEGINREFIRGMKNIAIEVLIPDFSGNWPALSKVIEAKPSVINHNIECVPRLYPKMRPQADYRRSLEILKMVREKDPSIYTKSGFMVGLGEFDEEVFSVLRDLRSVGCDIVTIGQYLPPSRFHPEVSRFVEPETFKWYERVALRMGFFKVFSGPFVRSSYKAGELYNGE